MVSKFFSMYTLVVMFFSYLISIIQNLKQLESDLLETQVPIPVYYAHETEEALELYNEITSTSSGYAAPSALKGIFYFSSIMLTLLPITSIIS